LEGANEALQNIATALKVRYFHVPDNHLSNCIIPIFFWQDSTPLSEYDRSQLLSTLQPIIASVIQGLGSVIADKRSITLPVGIDPELATALQTYDKASKEYLESLLDAMPVWMTCSSHFIVGTLG
jgi:hypothetical protein